MEVQVLQMVIQVIMVEEQVQDMAYQVMVEQQQLLEQMVHLE